MLEVLSEDIENGEALQVASGSWSSDVLGDEQKTDAVVALVSARVDQLARQREDRRNARVSLGISAGAVALAAIFAIVGWVFNEVVQARIKGVEDDLPAHVLTSVEESMVGIRGGLDEAISGAVEEQVARSVPLEVREKFGLEQDFLQASIIGVQLDLGTQYTRRDRDQLVQYFERFHDAPEITERPGFLALLQKTLSALAQANDAAELNSIVAMYPKECFGEPNIALVLAQHYVGQLSGNVSGRAGWDGVDLEYFRRCVEGLPSETEPYVLAWTLLVETRGAGAPTEIGRDLFEGSMGLGAEGRLQFLDLLIGQLHEVFLGRRPTRQLRRQAETAREVFRGYGEELRSLLAAMNQPDLTEILGEKASNSLMSGRTAEEVGQAVQEVLALFDETLGGVEETE